MTRWLVALFAAAGCRSEGAAASAPLPEAPAGPTAVASPRIDSVQAAEAAGGRAAMLELLKRRGIRDVRVLEAMAQVPRHELVPVELRAEAYADGPLPIGHGQTISQPYMVAFMSEAAAVGPGSKVLEVGTGSGYQAAVLAAMGCRVFTVEIVPALAERARQDLARLGYANVTVRAGDGYRGWAEEAPFDAVIVTAAPETVPPALLAQLADGGRLVIPVGPSYDQYLDVYTRRGAAIVRQRHFPVRFVPMTGEAQDPTLH